MIATVRIAPVERWCARHRKRKEYHALAGVQIEIIASESRIQKRGESTNWHGYDCRIWRLPASSVERIEQIIGRKLRFYPLDAPPAICEHMLEMD